MILLVAGGTAVATVAAYLAWLGWDQHYDRGPGGRLSGPYEAWQVAGLVLSLAAITGVAGWRRLSGVAIAVVPLTLTACVSVDWSTDKENDGLWVIGAGLVFFGSLTGIALFAQLTRWLATKAQGFRRTVPDA